jgi:hypothetical protein
MKKSNVYGDALNNCLETTMHKPARRGGVVQSSESSLIIIEIFGVVQVFIILEIFSKLPGVFV